VAFAVAFAASLSTVSSEAHDEENSSFIAGHMQQSTYMDSFALAMIQQQPNNVPSHSSHKRVT